MIRTVRIGDGILIYGAYIDRLTGIASKTEELSFTCLVGFAFAMTYAERFHAA
jgi:hypothetical protein